MDWWVILILLMGGLVFLMLKGMPVAFAFLIANLVAVVLLMGQSGTNQLVLSIYDSLTKFTLVPIPLFILMGEILFQSGLANKTLDVLGKWLGSMRARLSVIAIISGAIFANLSGSNIANTAMFGTLMVPEMRRQGYSKLMSLGPVMAAGGLAMIIPPSALAVLLGSLGHISIGKLLIAGILPGILLAVLYIGYIVGHCFINPSLAPVYKVETAPWSEKIMLLVRDVLPLGLIVFLSIGLIFLGVATPTEAAALGALGSMVLARVYGKLDMTVLKKSFGGAMGVTAMTFMILVGSAAFSQILAFSGATRGLVEMVVGMALPAIVVLIMMQIIVLILGSFMEQVSIMMITLPIFMPLVTVLKIDPIWFGVLMLINLDMGMLTPPFGMILFVMKGVAPKDVTMGDIIKAGLPFLILEGTAMAIIMIFPAIATVMPNVMLR